MNLGQLIYDKGGKNIQQRRDHLFSKWCWENWTATWKRIKVEYSLMPHTKMNSKQIKNLNVGGGVKMAEEQDGEITFSSTNSSKEQENGEESLQNNF